MNTALTYDDVLLVPRYSDIQSRKEVNLSSDLDNHRTLRFPVISSPMDTVTEGAMARAMSNYGGLGIIHRYNSIDEQVMIVKNTVYDDVRPVGAAIGVTGDYLERALTLVESGVDILCVDVAHGHHILVKNALTMLRKQLGDKIHLMAGNVATLEGLDDLADWGANSVRCNIGGGSICSTRIKTGHGLPGLQTILNCSKTDRDVKIIADGGIRTSGDIVKAIAAGADFVMLGSMLAGTDESPGEKIDTASGPQKRYRGMASKDAQLDWRGKYSSNEGISTFIDCKGSVKTILDDIHNGMTSGLSYSGCRTITELQGKARWVKQTSAGASEGRTHILRNE